MDSPPVLSPLPLSRGWSPPPPSSPTRNYYFGLKSHYYFTQNLLHTHGLYDVEITNTRRSVLVAGICDTE